MSVTVPLSSAIHDRVGELLLVLDTTNGRDKLCRLVQFTTKYLKWKHEQQLQQDRGKEEDKQRQEQMIRVWGNVSACMSIVRKVLRFGRSIAVLRSLQVILPSSPDQLTLQLTLQILAKLSLANYFNMDHLLFAEKMGLWQPSPKTLAIASTLTEGSWLGEIVFTLLEQLVILSRLPTQTANPADIAKRDAAFRSVVRNALDLPVALHFLGLTGNHPHGHFGVLGALSSLISLYEMWPTVLLK